MKNLFFLLLLFFLVACTTKTTKDVRPNILLIVADDLGYTDLGAFGGDIATPNLDALAANGLTFSRFHTAPLCAVTRSMLLSGNDNHIAGMGSQSLETEEFGYEGHLTDRIVPVPELLKKAGYHTLMAGKWHLGFSPDQYPIAKGFEQSFALLEGGGNHYSSKGIFKDYPVSPYVENEKETAWKEGDYSTDFYTSKLIEYMEMYQEDDQPFFAFAAYTTPHWPLQVDSAYWKKYEGKYDEGYEKLKKIRFENQKQLGLIPQDAKLPLPHPDVIPWDSLSGEEQRKESRKMELYAGMVDNMDVNIGRLINYLKETNQYENTLIIFFSDNGAAANDFYNHPNFKDFIREHYTDDYEEMGTKDSFISYGPQWAEAGASPFKYFKGYTTQGGINTPLILSGPGVNHQGTVTHAFTTLMDLAPTFYEIAGTTYPTSYNGKEVYPLKGTSMNSLLLGENDQVHDSTYVFALEHREHVVVRRGDWKLVNSIKPFDESNFELYDLKQDLAEQIDLKEKNPMIYQELLKEWHQYKEESKVQFPTPKSDS